MSTPQDGCTAADLTVIKSSVGRDRMLADRRSFVARVTKVTGLCGTPWLSAAATATARPLGTVLH